MLDDDDRITLIHQFIQDAQQDPYIFEMKTGRRLVQHVKRLARIFLGQFGRQFDTLALTAGESRGRLPQLDITQAYILQNLHFRQDRGNILEKLHRHIDRHIQNIRNGFPAKADFQRFPVVSLAMTFFTGNQHIRQEIHLDRLVTVPFARLATSAGDIERETSGFVATHFRFRQIHKQIADIRKDAGISSRITSRRTSDR